MIKNWHPIFKDSGKNILPGHVLIKPQVRIVCIHKRFILIILFQAYFWKIMRRNLVTKLIPKYENMSID